MSTNRKATMAKRAREMEQKDRAKEREQRRAERKQRADDRAASGQIGPEMGQPVSLDDLGPGPVIHNDSADDDAADTDGPDLPVPSTLAERTRPT